MRWPILLVLVAACGGSKAPNTPPVASVDIPSLLDKPIWDDELKDPTALQLLDRVKAALADSPPMLEGTDSAGWKGPLTDWIGRRAELGKTIRADVEALSKNPDPRFQLLAAIAYGVYGDDLVTDLTSIALPPEVRKEEYGAEVDQAFRQIMEEQAVPVAERTRTALQKCMQLAPQAATLLRVWEPFCRERDAKLGELVTRVAARDSRSPATAKQPPPAKPPALFADCDSKEPLHVAPTALPPDKKVKPSVVYVYTSEDIKDPADIAKLEAAVAAKLGKDTKMRVVDGKELAAARKLVAQNKLHANGPACGQAPPLTAVVAHKRKHLVIGEITSTCIYDGGKRPGKDKPRCGLYVQYERAGDIDHTGVPGPMFAPVERRDVSASDYIAAVAALAPSEGVAGLLGSLGTSAIFTDFAGDTDEDPWLRVGWTLRGETTDKLKDCVDAAASFDVTLTITREGKTKDVALAPVTAPAAGSKVTACVKSALEATPWPCTADGKPAKVAVRMCVAPRP